MNIKISSLALVAFFAAGAALFLLTRNGTLNRLLTEKQQRAERLEQQADSLNVVTVKQTARADSLASVLDSLVIERQIATRSLTETLRTLDEARPDTNIADAALAARFDSVRVLSPGLFAVGRDLLIDYDFVKHVRGAVYASVIREYRDVARVDSSIIALSFAEIAALRSALRTRTDEAHALRGRGDEYRDLYLIAENRRKKMKRRVIFGAAVVTGLAVATR